MHRITFIPFPLLTSERFILRQLTLSDGNEIFLLRSDKEINKYLDRPIAKTIDDAKQFIDKINDSILKNESIYWAIAIKNQLNLVGTICLWNISDKGTKAEIGFELLPEFHGKGIMQKELPMIIDYSLETMGLNFIDDEVDPKNLRSIKLMEKYGFKFSKKLESTVICSLQDNSTAKQRDG